MSGAGDREIEAAGGRSSDSDYCADGHAMDGTGSVPPAGMDDYLSNL